MVAENGCEKTHHSFFNPKWRTVLWKEGSVNDYSSEKAVKNVITKEWTASKAWRRGNGCLTRTSAQLPRGLSVCSTSSSPRKQINTQEKRKLSDLAEFAGDLKLNTANSNSNNRRIDDGNVSDLDSLPYSIFRCQIQIRTQFCHRDWKAHVWATDSCSTMDFKGAPVCGNAWEKRSIHAWFMGPVPRQLTCQASLSPEANFWPRNSHF